MKREESHVHKKLELNIFLTLWRRLLWRNPWSWNIEWEISWKRGSDVTLWNNALHGSVLDCAVWAQSLMNNSCCKMESAKWVVLRALGWSWQQYLLMATFCWPALNQGAAPLEQLFWTCFVWHLQLLGTNSVSNYSDRLRVLARLQLTAQSQEEIWFGGRSCNIVSCGVDHFFLSNVWSWS